MMMVICYLQRGYGVICKAEDSEEGEVEVDMEDTEATAVTDEVLEVLDVLEDFLVKDLQVVPTEVELLEVFKSVENPWGQLSELVFIEVQLLAKGMILNIMMVMVMTLVVMMMIRI